MANVSTTSDILLLLSHWNKTDVSKGKAYDSNVHYFWTHVLQLKQPLQRSGFFILKMKHIMKNRV